MGVEGREGPRRLWMCAINAGVKVSGDSDTVHVRINTTFYGVDLSQVITAVSVVVTPEHRELIQI